MGYEIWRLQREQLGTACSFIPSHIAETLTQGPEGSPKHRTTEGSRPIAEGSIASGWHPISFAERSPSEHRCKYIRMPGMIQSFAVLLKPFISFPYTSFTTSHSESFDISAAADPDPGPTCPSIPLSGRRSALLCRFSERQEEDREAILGLAAVEGDLSGERITR